MIEELDDVILTCDLPEHKLARGDIGTVVLVHRGGKGYEVEFTTLAGETIAIGKLGNSGDIILISLIRTAATGIW